MKKVWILLFLVQSVLLASEQGLEGYWNETLKYSDLVWQKTKTVTKDVIEVTKEKGSQGVDYTKQGLTKGKNKLLEQTLLLSMNMGLDYNDTIKATEVTVGEGNTTLAVSLFLKGEESDSKIVVRSFDWGVSKDEKYIVLENLDLAIDTPWLHFLTQSYLRNNNGYVVVENSFAKRSFLRTLRPSIESSYLFESNTTHEKEPTKEEIAINEIVSKGTNGEFLMEILGVFDYEDTIEPIEARFDEKGITLGLKLLGSKEPLTLGLEHFEWATANNGTLIVIGNFKFTDCSKPWVEAFLAKNKKRITLEYNPTLAKILERLTPQSDGAKL